MVVKVDYDSLSEEIQNQLKTFGTALNREINEGLKEVAEQTAETLRRGGPYNERSGKYTKGWDVKLRDRSYSSVTMTEEYTVYNKKYGRLTHLLEKGHVNRHGGRVYGTVRAFEHIKPAEELAEQMAISEVNKAVRRAAGEA